MASLSHRPCDHVSLGDRIYRVLVSAFNRKTTLVLLPYPLQLDHNLPLVPKRSKVIAIGSRNGQDTARRGDIVVFDPAKWQRMKGLSNSAMAYIGPPLVIEVVSTNWRDDY